MQELYLFQLTWSNPYTEPPEGKPRLLAEICSVVRHPAPKEFVEACERLHALGDGYGVRFFALKPRQKQREWTRERKAAHRRRLLEQRVKRKNPLFADEFIAQAIAQKPSYFEGDARPDIESAREAALQSQDDEYHRFAANVGILFIYDSIGQSEVGE